ncbi:hypothetical protein [Rhodoferax sp.]|uniref:hypothetical protein n=1 Tax=Rhodoferax sp. TaxID=50421 RepID=UPI002852A240|nr:hypothetical protein [Rhodoferax sp.]
MTVTFQDHGQDFLEWDIKDMTVVGCRPFQAWVWVGKKVHTMPTLPMQQIVIINEAGEPRPIRYPVVKIKPQSCKKLSRPVLNSKVVTRGAQALLAKYKNGATS